MTVISFPKVRPLTALITWLDAILPELSSVWEVCGGSREGSHCCSGIIKDLGAGLGGVGMHRVLGPASVLRWRQEPCVVRFPLPLLLGTLFRMCCVDTTATFQS